ncbi:MAG TPA: ribonuclease T2 [Candidatus Angelobacter sp.]|nr:ribonuclease T2 [Candidatus Angelobacter sp.]
MGKRLTTLVLLVVLCVSVSGNGFARHKNNQSTSDASSGTVGVFDYYLLTLSWAPEFCATNAAGRSSAECATNKHMGLVVHGLWPQYDNGKWPQDCASSPPVASSTVDHMMPIMPGSSLIQHEWAKHGTCSGLAVNDYFGAIEKLYTGLTVPDSFKKPAGASQTNPGDIEAAFASANNAPKEAFRVSCPQNEFSAVEVCLSKDLKYMACPATMKECKAPEIKVRPVP